MSTTGPVTRATRPTPTSPECRCVCTATAELMACGLSCSASAGQRVRATDDLGDLLGDLLLPRVVREARVLADEGVGVVARRLHGPLRGRVLAGCRLEHRGVDPGLDVDRQQRVEHLAGVGLELVERQS